MSNYSNMKTSFGNPEDKNSQAAFQVRLELLTQNNRYLEQVKELTAIYGAERVLEFMQLGGLISTTPKNESIGSAPSDVAFELKEVQSYLPKNESISSALPDTKSQESSGADLIKEVEVLGLKLNPHLINLIASSTVSQVKTAIAKYKTYRQVTNPEGLFYRILSNEQKKAISLLK